MAGFARLIKTLQLVFPSSGTETHSVDDLGETVVPVLDFPPSSISIERARLFQDNAPAVVTPQLNLGLSGNTSPATHKPDELRASTAPFISSFDHYVEILAMDVSHDSATARGVQLLLRSPQNLNVFVARWTNMLAVLTPGQPSGFEPVLTHPTVATAGSDARTPSVPLCIPPGWVLQVLGNTAGAGYSVFVSLSYIAHPLAERRFFP